MTTHAAGGFVIDAWDEEAIEEVDGGRVYRVRIGKTFSGDMPGTSEGWMTMAMTAAGSAAYVGFERITTELDGHVGTFLLHHNAGMSAQGQHGSCSILGDSGTAGLVGITGTAVIDRHDDGTHTYTLDYDLPS